MLDLNSIDTAGKSEAGNEIELLYNGEPTGAFIKIRGEKSTTVKEWARQQFTHNQQKELNARARGKDVLPMTVTEIEDMVIHSASIRVISWRGVMDGKTELPCTPENVVALLKKDDSFSAQILEESRILANFLKS